MPSTIVNLGRKNFWNRRPLLPNAIFTDLQNGSYVASIYSIIESIFILHQTTFDAYVLFEAEPGTIHYRYFGINFIFVYSGNRHVRNLLILTSLVMFVLFAALLVTSIILMKALRKEKQKKFKPWITCNAICTTGLVIGTIYRSIANDLYFSYHQAILVIFTIIIILNTFFGLVVYSNQQELEDIARLEDMARLKTSTLSSLTSRSLSHYSIDAIKSSFTTTPMGSMTTASV